MDGRTAEEVIADVIASTHGENYLDNRPEVWKTDAALVMGGLNAAGLVVCAKDALVAERERIATWLEEAEEEHYGAYPDSPLSWGDAAEWIREGCTKDSRDLTPMAMPEPGTDR